MKKLFNIKWSIGMLLVACFIICGTTTASAQRMIRVSGTVYNVADKKNITPVTEAEVLVYSCKTVAEAMKLKKDLDEKSSTVAVVLDGENVVKIDRNGYYEISVPDNGALVFKSFLANAILMEVNNHHIIDVTMDLGLKLDEVVITGIRTELGPEPTIGEVFGNKMSMKNTFDIPQQTGNSYSRLVIQPYAVSCGSTKVDTIGFCNPIVVDGEKFHGAQIRKMGYDLSRDPLEKFRTKDKALSGKAMQIEWGDTVILPNPKANYSCYADFIIESTSGIDYKKTFQIVSCKSKRPLMMLEYTLTSKDMDFYSVYNRETAQIEKRNAADKVSLTFQINSDRLTETEENIKNMNSIKEKLQGILAEEGTTLKELYITGYSSPDGNYASNKALAQQRTNRIMSEVVGILPKNVNDMLYKMPDADVKPWTEVARLMKEDSLYEEAERIEKIIAETPDNIEKQGAAIKQLGFYDSKVKEYLNRLREVEYSIKYDVYREPTDEEVMAAYRKKGMNGIFTRYEYWKLFQMIHDSKELETLALKAYKESIDEERPWALAGNIVAVKYLERDYVDTLLLKPLIDKAIYTSNYERRGVLSNRMEIVNPAEVINNQLCMYIKKMDFENASIMAKMLPDTDEYKLIKAYAWALGGYYKGGKTPEEKERCKTTFETIKASSSRNEVVMCLALNSDEGNAMAQKALSKLPADDAVTFYFKAILAARKGDVGMTDAMINLYQCFLKDKSFLHTAKNDGEFTDETVEGAEDMLMY